MTLSALTNSLNDSVTKMAAGAAAYVESTATSITLTAAQLVDGFFNQTGGTTNTVTTPTAAAIVAAIPGCVVGSQFTWTVNNNGSGTLTLAGGTGVTVEGAAATVATTVFSVAVGVVTNVGTPAVVIGFAK